MYACVGACVRACVGACLRKSIKMLPLNCLNSVFIILTIIRFIRKKKEEKKEEQCEKMFTFYCLKANHQIKINLNFDLGPLH